MADEPTAIPPPDVAAMLKAMQEQITGLAESVKPKPERTDRQVLDSINEGLTGLVTFLKGSAAGGAGTPPPPVKPEPVAATAKKPKGNPFLRHHSA